MVPQIVLWRSLRHDKEVWKSIFKLIFISYKFLRCTGREGLKNEQQVKKKKEYSDEARWKILLCGTITNTLIFIKNYTANSREQSVCPLFYKQILCSNYLGKGKTWVIISKKAVFPKLNIYCFEITDSLICGMMAVSNNSNTFSNCD